MLADRRTATPTIELTEASAWAGGRRLFAFVVRSSVAPPQTLLVLRDLDGGESCDQWVLIDGDFDVNGFERPATSMEERFERIAGGALTLSAAEGHVSLRASFAAPWELHVGLRGRRMTSTQGSSGRWRVAAAGVGDLRDVISCLRGMGEASERTIGVFEDPGVPVFQIGRQDSANRSVLAAALGRLDDDGARTVSALLAQMGAAKDTESVVCQNCGQDFTRSCAERWKMVCRACFSDPARVRARPVRLEAAAEEEVSQASAGLRPVVVAEQVLIERIDACLLPHGLKLRRGVLVPFVVIRIADGTIARSKIMDLEALGRGLEVLQPQEEMEPAATTRRSQSV